MDFWVVILICSLLFGVMGWGCSLAFNAVWWFLEWKEGNEINWGWETVSTVAIPFAYLFVIFEVVLLYSP
jgi:hypothetical protein